MGDDESLRTATSEIEQVNWIALEHPNGAFRAAVKIRHKHTPANATVEPLDATRVRVTFDGNDRISDIDITEATYQRVDGGIGP